MRDYYSEVYSPENILVTAAGNLTHEKLVSLAAERFETVKPTGPLPALLVPSTHARISLKSKKELEQVHVCVGVPCYPISHEDRLHLLRAQHRSRRRHEFPGCSRTSASARVWPTPFFSELNPYADTGCLAVYAGTSLESARKVVESILKEFTELKQQEVPAEELRRAKDHLKGSLMLSLESTSSRMSNLARQEMHFQRFFTLDELVESIEKVTSGEVQRVAQDFFDQHGVALTILGNLEGFKIGREDLVC